MSEGNKTKFQEFLAGEIAKYRGVAIPRKAGLLERMFKKSVYNAELHPNPNDEFCDPKIGPNYEIIARYEHDILNSKIHSQVKPIEEPLTVEKMYPDGYMLLNGHHRWAAAIRMSLPRLPINIVNLTQTMDIQKMLKNAKHDRRVTLDLDEVVFLEGEGAAETPQRSINKKKYPEQLRRGIPALFHFLKTNGYDIWVYTAKYYSLEYIRKYFRKYQMKVDGIITGTARKDGRTEEQKKELEAEIARKYPVTVHIDMHSVVKIDSRTKKFEEIPLSGEEEKWSGDVMEAVGETKE